MQVFYFMMIDKTNHQHFLSHGGWSNAKHCTQAGYSGTIVDDLLKGCRNFPEDMLQERMFPKAYMLQE
jgi:hypothetical protein